jgi:hypothetical protein
MQHRAIAYAGPGARVWCIEERLNLVAVEVSDQPLIGLLRGDRKELLDLLISGVVRTAADNRRNALAGNASGLRNVASGLWDWLTKKMV